MNGPLLFRKVLGSVRSGVLKHNYSTDSEAIKIPKRIQRGPTDILRALASTHKRDVLAAHYKYHDDPYLIPQSNSKKRKYALSLEAGRKAALWIRQEHADLFNHSVADPPIELFVPSKVYKEDSQATVDDLKSTISHFLVSDSITVYNSLKNQGIEIDGDLKQSLLELLCYYNCEEGVNEEWLEERWFRASSQRRSLEKKTWKDGSLAEEVFKSIKPATAEAYSAIICGMAKYGQVEGALKLFEEATAANMELSLVVYNQLLARVSFIKESHELMWQQTLNLLNQMKLKGLTPDLGTFNSVLETLGLMSKHRNSKRYALEVFSEMKKLGIQPSLASFYHLINVYYSGPLNSKILYDIVDCIDGKSHTVSDINDCMFFVTAMEMCRHKLHQVSLAYRIDEILHSNQNEKLIGDSFRESLYYRYFFSLLCECEPLDEFMKVYDKWVPHLYIPEPSVMLEVLNSVEVNLGYQYLPKLWTDIVQFEINKQEPLLVKILELMNQTDDPELSKQFAKIGWNIWELIEGQTRERNLIGWTTGMLSDLMKLLLNNNELAKANLVFDKLDRLQDSLTGEPDMGVIKLYVKSCVQNDSINSAIKCVRYCQDMGFGEAGEFASLIEESPFTTDQQKQRLNAMLGKSTASVPS